MNGKEVEVHRIRRAAEWTRARPHVRRTLLAAWVSVLVLGGLAVLELVSRRVFSAWHGEVSYRHLQPYLMSGGYAANSGLVAANQGFGGPDSYGYRRLGGSYLFDFEKEVMSVAERGTFLFQDRVALADSGQAATTRRIFVLGGSAAFGVGASSPDERWYAHLERSLSADLAEPVRVVPSAMIGYVSTQERIVLDLMVLPRSPDLVIILNGYNDAALPVTFGMRPGDPYDTGILYENFYSPLFGLKKWIADRSHLASVLVQSSVARGVRRNEERLLADPDLLRNYQRSTAAVYLDNVDHMLRRCGQEGLRCLVFLQPTRPLTRREMGVTEEADPFTVGAYDLILEATRSSASSPSVHDLTSVFSQPDWERFYRDDVHFTDEGHALVAEAMRPIVRAALEGPE